MVYRCRNELGYVIYVLFTDKCHSFFTSKRNACIFICWKNIQTTSSTCTQEFLKGKGQTRNKSVCSREWRGRGFSSFFQKGFWLTRLNQLAPLDLANTQIISANIWLLSAKHSLKHLEWGNKTWRNLCYMTINCFTIYTLHISDKRMD